MKIFNTVKETKEKYDQRYEELLIQKGQLKKQLEELRREYEERITEDELGGKVFTSKPQMKEKLRNLEDELEEVEHRISVNRKGLRQALADLVPAIKDHRDKKKAQLQKKYEEAVDEVAQAVANYFESLQRVHNLRKDFEALTADVRALESEVGSTIEDDKTSLKSVELWHYTPAMSTSRGYIPSRVGGATVYAIMQSEIETALNSGTIPVRVQEYLEAKKGGKK